MKNQLLLLILLGIYSCNRPSGISDATIMGLADLPVTATKVPDTNNPDLVKVSFVNSQGATETGDYLLGKRIGNWIETYPNGIIKSSTGYINGMKHGAYLEIDNKGQLQISANYRNDQLNGKWVNYNRARVKEERNYVDGRLEGKVSIYYDKGTIMEEGNYKNGVRDGVNKWYDQEGNVSIEYEYDNGELIKK